MAEKEIDFTVVFDLDGTLADTSADLLAAANACFAARGLQVRLDPSRDAAIAFQGGRAMLREGFARAASAKGHGQGVLIPPTAVDEDYPRLLDHYARDIAVHTRLYDGVVAALDALSARGVRLAVCTNKPEALARRLLEELGILDRFAALIGADTLPVRKPDPRPYVAAVKGVGGTVARSVMIGDTETDVKTARAAGVPVVLVGFGPLGEGVLRLKPDAILPDYADLVGMMGQWLR